MKYFAFVLLAWLPVVVFAQPFTLTIQPVLHGQAIRPDADFPLKNGDTIQFETFRCYVGQFVFLKDNKTVFEEKQYHLVDFETEKSMNITFKGLDASTDFDALQFNLGVDSLTTASGVMGGDLDPSKGLFWAWQSGYINVKIEGNLRNAQRHDFEYHLGGYLSPFQSVQQVVLNAHHSKSSVLNIELAPFFQADIAAQQRKIMSPGASAVRLMAILAHSITVHE